MYLSCLLQRLRGNDDAERRGERMVAYGEAVATRTGLDDNELRYVEREDEEWASGAVIRRGWTGVAREIMRRRRRQRGQYGMRAGSRDTAGRETASED